MDKDKGKNLTELLSNKIYNDSSSQTVGEDGYTLLSDSYLIEKLAHFNRERIPERVVHAKGAGAKGEFIVENDLSKYCCASFLSTVGKKTPIFMRFSTVGGEKGSADSVRDPRGFAIKFYTQDGNLDIVGNDTPVFFIRDPIKFPDFIHSQKRNATSNLKDPDVFWDFLSLNPESIHQVLILFTDRGTPKTFRNMHGFGTNTFVWYNKNKDYVFVKYHFLTNQGIKNNTEDEATILAGTDPDSSTKDLFNAIEKGEFPKWKMYVQIMTEEQSESYEFDPFDTTKVWYHKDFPLIPVGTLTLNENPDNFFREVEQAAFSPGNMVRGIFPSRDRMLLGRMFAYPDTQRYRLGANFGEIPVNKPLEKSTTYMRDGSNQRENIGSMPNYFPNSFDNNFTNGDLHPPKIETCGKIGRYNFALTPKDFLQANALLTRVLKPCEIENTIENIVGSLRHADYLLQYRQTALFYLCEKSFGLEIAQKLGLDQNSVIRLAEMPNEDRIKATQNKQ